MKRECIGVYVCPESGEPLKLASLEDERDGEVIRGVLVSENGNEYRIANGIPDLTYPPELSQQDSYTRSFYDGRGEAYDNNLHLTFKTHNEDEQEVRNRFVDALELQPSYRVLKVS